MKRFSLLGLGLLVVLVATAAAATSALAVQPSNLPTGVKKYTGAAEGETEFHSSQGIVICKTAASEGGEETSNEPPTGPFHIAFKECKNKETGIVCTGLGDGSGIILALGTTKLVFDRPAGGTFTELTTATLFLVNTVHFSCSGLILIEVKGEVVCLDLKPTEANTKHSFHCTGRVNAETKKLESNEEWCKGGDVASACVEPTKPKLEESVNHAAFTEAVQLGLGNNVFSVAVTGMT